MTFQQLLEGAEVLSQSGSSNGNPPVTGVEYDSRRVRPGTVFVAMKGETSDGNRFIDQAIAAGAVAIVTDSAAVTPRPAVAWTQDRAGRNHRVSRCGEGAPGSAHHAGIAGVEPAFVAGSRPGSHRSGDGSVFARARARACFRNSF